RAPVVRADAVRLARPRRPRAPRQVRRPRGGARRAIVRRDGAVPVGPGPHVSAFARPRRDPEARWIPGLLPTHARLWGGAGPDGLPGDDPAGACLPGVRQAPEGARPPRARARATQAPLRAVRGAEAAVGRSLGLSRRRARLDCPHRSLIVGRALP